MKRSLAGNEQRSQYVKRVKTVTAAPLNSSPHRIQNDPRWSSMTWKGFFDLPQELRDAIYDLSTHDVPYAHYVRRDTSDLSSNRWEIGYVEGPYTNGLVLSKALAQEYLERLMDRMMLVVHVSVHERSIGSEAPWYSTLPDWVKRSVRGVRLVVSLARTVSVLHAGLLTFTAEEVYSSIEDRVDAAVEHMAQLDLLDMIIVYSPARSCYDFDRAHNTLVNNISVCGLDVQDLLGIRPLNDTLSMYCIGMMLDMRSLSAPRYADWDDEGYGPLWFEQEELLEGFNYNRNDEYVMPEDYIIQFEEQRVKFYRWYATLNETDDPTTNYLGLDWEFIGELTAADVGDDGAFGELLEDEDGDSQGLSDESLSEEDWVLDEDDEQLVAQDGGKCLQEIDSWTKYGHRGEDARAATQGLRRGPVRAGKL